jgi:hypothetical protein
VLIHKKRTSNTIIQGRQGLNCKNQDLSARILLGGRTGMLKQIYSGALLTRSPNPHRGSWIQRLPARACAVDRTVSSAHGSPVDRPLNAKGYAIWAVHARSKGSGRLQAKATASTPECGGARRGLAGVAPRRRSRPSTRPQVSAKRRGWRMRT